MKLIIASNNAHKIYEIKKACGNDPEKIKTYLKSVYHIDL